mmetsp:Transcript_43192/g.92157  ORF Transcript_43192/g.92157 Transcript_43192/m.92157 type:complete len:201 (+) Transcript_43192:182-784(+)
MAVGALHLGPLQHRVACHGTRQVLEVALPASEVSGINVSSALVTLAQVQLLLHTLVHGPPKDPIPNLLNLGPFDVRFIGQVQVIWRWNISVYKVGVVDRCILRIVNSIGVIKEPVQEEERHVDHVRVLAVKTRFIESPIYRELGAIAAECGGDFGDNFRRLAVCLEPLASRHEVCGEQGLVELDNMRIPVINEVFRGACY